MFHELLKHIETVYQNNSVEILLKSASSVTIIFKKNKKNNHYSKAIASFQNFIFPGKSQEIGASPVFHKPKSHFVGEFSCVFPIYIPTTVGFTPPLKH
jgi:hypothetical protein